MKNISLFTVGLFLATAVFGQTKPIYFNGNKIITDSTKASSYAVYGKLSAENLWVFKRYDLYNNLIQTGSYKDSLLSMPHGKFTFYNYIDQYNAENNEHYKTKGKLLYVAQIGNFVDGLEQGQWRVFYPDGNLLSIQNFLDGKLHGECKVYDKHGKLLIYGNYLNDERNGEWLFINEGKKAVYDQGTLLSTDLIPKNKP